IVTITGPASSDGSTTSAGLGHVAGEKSGAPFASGNQNRSTMLINIVPAAPASAVRMLVCVASAPQATAPTANAAWKTNMKAADTRARTHDGVATWAAT